MREGGGQEEPEGGAGAGELLRPMEPPMSSTSLRGDGQSEAGAVVTACVGGVGSCWKGWKSRRPSRKGCPCRCR